VESLLHAHPIGYVSRLSCMSKTFLFRTEPAATRGARLLKSSLFDNQVMAPRITIPKRTG